MPDARPLPLTGCYVISLRPAGLHAPLRRLARAAGAQFIALSSLRIEPLDDDDTRRQLADALANADHVLATSPTAVRAAAKLQPLSARAGQQWHAVGAGSAAALRRAGITEVQAPSRMDSEGLLAMPALHQVQRQSIALLTGSGGRGLLQPALTERGARVRRVDLYSRRTRRPATRALQQLAATGDAPTLLALTSGEAVETLLAQLDDRQRAHLRKAHVLAASARLADLARTQGFDRVDLAAGPRPTQLVAAMVDAARTPPRNRC